MAEGLDFLAELGGPRSLHETPGSKVEGINHELGLFFVRARSMVPPFSGRYPPGVSAARLDVAAIILSAGRYYTRKAPAWEGKTQKSANFPPGSPSRPFHDGLTRSAPAAR
jgi:hypothetical protein